MTKNLMTRYLEYKKKRLVSYALCLYKEQKYLDFEIECLKRYANNYVEALYHHKFETLDDNIKVDSKAIEIEQEGIRLELQYSLSAREIIETNSSFTIKKSIIDLTKKYMEAIISFDKKKITEENVEKEITNIIVRVSKGLPVLQNALSTWTKKWKETNKTIKNILAEKEIFVLNQKPYIDRLWEITLLNNVKQLNVYKKSLLTRVNQEDKIEQEKIKVTSILISKAILQQIINKEHIGYYLMPIPEGAWSKKEVIEEVFNLLDDVILKDHIYIGINYNQMINSKYLQNKKKEGYHFACYQDMSHINDIPTKIQTIDTSGYFDYLVIKEYKAKDLATIEKEEPTIMKAILISKEG